jgi:hypothetical protein
MKASIIDFFQAAVSESFITTKKLQHDFIKKSLNCGYIVDPSLIGQPDVNEYLDSLKINPNATFYTTFDEVVSKDRLQLFIDQLIHYSSTYGTDYTGDTLILNENFGKDLDVDFTSMKFLRAVTEDEMMKMCIDSLCTGVAMKESLVRDICEYIINHYCRCHTIVIDDIKNKEAQAILSCELNLMPTKGIDMIRCMVYNATKSAMVVKDSKTIMGITRSGVDLSRFTEDQMIELSKCFFRFKPLFLAFKKANRNNHKIINKIRKYANTYHQPMQKDILTNILDPAVSLAKKYRAIDKCSLFKKVQLLNFVKENMDNFNTESVKAYIIRNQKAYIKHHTNNNFNRFSMCQDLQTFLLSSIKTSLAEKICVVKYPENYELAVPISQKSFVGNLPIGTYYNMTKDNVIGCYWRNEWGTRDFDLSLVSADGRQRYGWNSSYYDSNPEHKIIYSGDMTNANPEAAECIYVSEGAPDSVVYINRYNGDDGSKYKLFFAQEAVQKMKKNYMVNPGNIQMQTMCTSEKRQQMVGIINDGKAYMVTLHTGDTMVSSTRNARDVYDAMVNNVKHRTTLREIFDVAGFIDYSKLDEANKAVVDADPEVPVLDLTNISAGDLIKFLS